MCGLAKNVVLDVVVVIRDPAKSLLDIIGGPAEVAAPWSSADAAISATALSPTTTAIRFTLHSAMSPVGRTNLGQPGTGAANWLPIVTGRRDSAVLPVRTFHLPHQPVVPGPPLNGPTTRLVIHPP
jgi:hypothetical protein